MFFPTSLPSTFPFWSASFRPPPLASSQGKGQRDHLARNDGHRKAEKQEDRGVPGLQLGEHQRLDQSKGRWDRLGREDDLQPAIELQMVEELRRQNVELRKEVKALNEKITRGQCHQDRTPGPKTPTTAMFTPMEQPVRVRRTPGGSTGNAAADTG